MTIVYKANITALQEHIQNLIEDLTRALSQKQLRAGNFELFFRKSFTKDTWLGSLHTCKKQRNKQAKTHRK